MRRTLSSMDALVCRGTAAILLATVLASGWIGVGHSHSIAVAASGSSWEDVDRPAPLDESACAACTLAHAFADPFAPPSTVAFELDPVRACDLLSQAPTDRAACPGRPRGPPADA